MAQVDESVKVFNGAIELRVHRLAYKENGSLFSCEADSGGLLTLLTLLTQKSLNRVG